MRKYQVLSVLFFLIAALLAFNKYVNHHRLHNQWIVIYKSEKNDIDYFIEARINLYKLRNAINDSDVLVKDVIWDLFKDQLQNHSFAHVPNIPIKSCDIEDMLGNLNGGILLQVRCSVKLDH